MGLLAGVGERWRISELVARYVGAARYWSPATAARRETAARMVADDQVGAVRVGRLSPAVLEAAMDLWRAAGMSTATIRARHDVVRFAVSWAVGQQWLAVDVLSGVGGVPGCWPRGQVPVSTVRAVVAAARADLGRAEERFVRCGWSPSAELALFRTEQRLLLVYLVADTGMRRGELAGLRSDDLLGRELWIERAVKRGSEGGVVVGPTKSHRYGRLTVSAATARCWHEHVGAWRERRSVGGRRSGWLFRTTPQAERPISTSALADRFAKVKALAGCGKASLHGVRHTVATSLALAGQLPQAQERLRHRALGTTARHYVDCTGLDDEPIADDLERVFLTRSAPSGESPSPTPGPSRRKR